MILKWTMKKEIKGFEDILYTLFYMAYQPVDV